MKTFLVALLVFALAVGAAFLYRDFYLKRKFLKLSEEKYRTLSPLIQRVTDNRPGTESEILETASNASLRHTLFMALSTARRADMFPLVYFTQEKGAEASLVNWLEFPTELGAVPDEIEFIERILLPRLQGTSGEGGSDRELYYFAFRYRMLTSHWATKFGWMIGVAGPYLEHSAPYDLPRKVFSRFNTAESISTKDEVIWVHENVNKS